MRSSGDNDGRAEWFGNTVQFTTIQVGRRQPFYPTQGSLPLAADAMADIHSNTDTNTAASALRATTSNEACSLQDATHLSNQMGRSPDMLAASDDAHLAAHQCQQPILPHSMQTQPTLKYYTANCLRFASGGTPFRDLLPQMTHLAHRRVRRGRPIVSFSKYITLGCCQSGAKQNGLGGFSAKKKKSRP